MGYTYSYSYAVGEVRSQILQRFWSFSGTNIRC